MEKPQKKWFVSLAIMLGINLLAFSQTVVNQPPVDDFPPLGTCGTPAPNAHIGPVSPQNGNGSHGQTFNLSKCGLNYTQATLRLGRRGSLNGTPQPATYVITGIPVCRTIERAYLYASLTGTPVAFNVTIVNPQSQSFTFPAVNIGTGADKCWGYGGSTSIRVDVTTAITGNGNYIVSGFPTNPPTAQKDTDGATLFIIFSDPTANYQGHMVIHDGAIVGIGGNTTSGITGINACATSIYARLFIMAGDFQLAGTQISSTLGPNFACPWNWWNYNEGPVTVPAATANATVNCLIAPGDCYLWVVTGLYYRTNTCTTCPLPNSLTLTTTTVPATCSNCNGSATVTATGGTPPYTYLWVPTNQTTQTATGLCAGTYTVTVTDATGCLSATTTVTITSAGGGLTLTPNITNVSCNGLCNGSVALTVTGGQAPYTYVWTPSAQTTATATGLCAGTYTVVVTDAAGCTSTGSYTITQPTALQIAPTQTNPVCNGACTGTATATASGGTPGYTYSWSTIPAQNTPTATGLCAGTYTVTVTDANGCTRTQTYTITQPTAVTASATSTPATCNQNNGSATVTGSGGTPGYTYSWNPTGQTTATATGLGPATYTVTVTDANGCTGTTTVTVNSFASPILTITSSTNVTCFGACNGTITTSVTGGTPPLTYTWAPSGGNGPNATGLCPGTYTVTVTDANGCTSTGVATITEPPLLTITAAGFSALCNGACNGQVVCIPAGGTQPYNILWTPGNSTTASVNGLCAGTYTVLITDANGCTVTDTAIVSQPPALAATTTVDTSHCNLPDGQACVTASGGVPPYSYNWNTTPAQTTACATGLTPGQYCVTITDANGCTLTACGTVPLAPGVVLSLTSSTNVTCFNACNGTANVSATGGVGPYNFVWNTVPAQNTANATGLCAGTYTCTVTDASGCIDTATVTITQPPQLVVTVTNPPPICIGQCVTLTANITGGTPTYTTTWSPAGPNVCPTITTVYTVNVTDANGCTATPQQVTVTVNDPLSVTAAVNPSPICVGSSATLTANGIGGSGTGYTYTWMPGNLNGNSVNVSPTATTTYTVTLTDNCNTPSATATVTLVVNPSPVIPTIAPSAGCAPYCTTFTDLTPNAASWNWTFNGGSPASATTSPTPQVCWALPGSYNVVLTVTDANGCSSTATVTTVTVHPNPIAGFTASPDSVSVLNPEICFTNTSSNAATYLWDFGDPQDQNNNSTLTNPCHTYTDTGMYCVKLVVASQYQCMDSITQCVYVMPDFTLYVPNAFTPDGNNTNDWFFPKGEGIDESKFEMWIFDRWGNNIFYTQQWGKAWDGRANGGKEIAQEDVYVWKIVVYDFLGKKHSYVGHVSLIR